MLNSIHWKGAIILTRRAIVRQRWQGLFHHQGSRQSGADICELRASAGAMLSRQPVHQERSPAIAANIATQPELLTRGGSCWPFPEVPVGNFEVRLRPHHHKHRIGVGQFHRIHCSYRAEYLRRTFCPCHDTQGRRSFVGRGT